MFGRIARRYDLLNRVLSLGIDQAWRRATVKRAGSVKGQTGLDLCCGTGDLTLAFGAQGAAMVGLDFTPEMLPLARDKGQRAGTKVQFVRGDAMQVAAGDAQVDFTSVSFGIRNVSDRVGCLREMSRVTKPGGLVLVLEFTMPPGAILGRLYRFYFLRILPLVGRLVSKHNEAYSYLPKTVLAWPAPDAFEAEMRSVGLEGTGYRLLTRGIACLHWGSVPHESA
jgi:demethylmenaquinone methyltransferase / 2-methoxy-6-polyprenyl-1,4-benzoquinol methylase